MILAYRGLPVLPSVPLAEECVQAGGYVRNDDHVDGLFYRPFARWIESRFAISATVLPDVSAALIRTCIDRGDLAMISVHPWIRWHERMPPKRGGHLVLVTGTGHGYVQFHNPSGLPGQNQEHARIPVGTLNRFYAGRAILIHP